MRGDYGAEESSPAAESVESDENSFLAPKDAFGECKEGDTYTVKVLGVFGDEVELAKVEKESKADEGEESTPERRMDEMAGV